MGTKTKNAPSTEETTNKTGETPLDDLDSISGSQTDAGESAGDDTDAPGEDHPNPDRAASDEAETAANADKGDPGEGDPAPEPAVPAKVSDALQKAGLALLAHHPDADTIYVTADGVGFFDEGDATNHARRLTTTTVATVKREPKKCKA